MEGDRERCLRVGMDDYLSKPTSLDRLWTSISRWQTAAEPAAFERGEIPLIALPDVADFVPALPADMLAELMPLFLRETDKSIQQLGKIISSGKLKEVTHLAQELETSSLGLGANRVAAVCSEIRSACANGRTENLPALLTELTTSFVRVKESATKPSLRVAE